jgi:hypothetical protein
MGKIRHLDSHPRLPPDGVIRPCTHLVEDSHQDWHPKASAYLQIPLFPAISGNEVSESLLYDSNFHHLQNPAAI